MHPKVRLISRDESPADLSTSAIGGGSCSALTQPMGRLPKVPDSALLADENDPARRLLRGLIRRRVDRQAVRLRRQCPPARDLGEDDRGNKLSKPPRPLPARAIRSKRRNRGLKPLLVCQACGARGVDIRPDWDWELSRRRARG
jgi:hypothetical protein